MCFYKSVFLCNSPHYHSYLQAEEEFDWQVVLEVILK